MPKLLLISLIGVFAAFSLFAFAQDQPTRVRKVGPDVQPPIPTNTPAATLPPDAKGRHASGICVVSLIVSEKGLPESAKIRRCTDSIFEQSALDAVNQYRFKPGRTVHGDQAVPVMITIVINFGMAGEPPVKVSYALASPPGTTTLEPDAQGVYPLSKEMQLPQMTKFVSRGFGWAAAPLADESTCSVLMVLDAKGKPRTAKTESCDAPVLSNAAEVSLAKSKFTPATLNGRPVPVRFVIKLVYAGFEKPSFGSATK